VGGKIAISSPAPPAAVLVENSDVTRPTYDTNSSVEFER